MIRIAFIDLGSRLVQYFAEVSKRLSPDIEAFFYCTKPKAWSIAQQLGLRTFPERGHRFDTVDIPRSISDEILNLKIIAETPDRRRLMARLERLYPSLRQFLEGQRIDAVFLWNGSGLVASTTTSLARQMGLKTLFGENGYFFNTMQLDPEGVNQASSITGRIGKEYELQEIEESKLQALQSLIRAYRTNALPQVASRPSRTTASWFARLTSEWANLRENGLKWPKALNKTVPSDPGELPRNFIFVPFQVVKDSQLLLYSPLVGNDMALLLSSCHEAAKSAAPGYKIVVKLHPADVNHVDYTGLMERFPDVIFLKDYPSNSLIKAAVLIITINSTVGVEALIHDKPVITLGDNFYNVPDVVHHVESLSDLPQAISKALSTPPDKEKIQRLLYYLYHNYFAHGSWKDFSPRSIEAVAAKISELLHSDD